MTYTARSNAGYAARIVRNAGALLGGKALGGLLSIVYLAIAARSLGPAEMGYLVLANAYAMTVAGVARFQSWQAVIRFGAPMAAENNDAALASLLKFTIKLDLASAVLGVALAMALVEPVSSRLHWPADAKPLIYVYCLAIPFLIAATPTGVLRLFDRFKSLSWQLAVMPLVRFIGAILAGALNLGLKGFLIAWIAGAFFNGVTLWWLGWRELKARNLVSSVMHSTQKPAPGWFGFTLKTNFASTFDLARQNLPVLIVGAVLGSTASGFLQLATNLTNLIAHPMNMLSHATYPELSRIVTVSGETMMRNVALRSTLTGLAAAAPIVLVYAVFGRGVASLVGGPEFAAAGVVVALMAFVQIFRTIWIVAEAAVLALGHAGMTLFAQGASALIQLLLLFVLMGPSGVNAAPMSLIAGFSLMIAIYSLRLFGWKKAPKTGKGGVL